MSTNDRHHLAARVAAAGITIASASAGSGKTYRLTKDITEAVDPTGPAPIPLEGLLAVTYTRKANAELSARIRQKLVGAGAFDEALRLPLAYLGTVHAACLRLLQEFALDAGLSPHVDVVADDAGKLLRQSLEAALSVEAREELDRLAARLQLRYQPITKRHDWLGPVANIMDLARSNRIAPEALPAMAARSVQGLLALLPPPERDAQALDDALAAALTRAHKNLVLATDGVALTEDAITLLDTAIRKLRDDELCWSDWAKLAAVKVGKSCRDLVTDLQDVASRYDRHPRLHADLRAMTFAIFDAARVGLTAYAAWKERRRVVDYVDMLDRALDLVSHPRVASELADRLRLVMVDEFQDTSPIQLALFMKLHALAGRSTWVGDRKQCIFEYAGADPLLMDAVADCVTKGGGTRDVLSDNWRSRPELVEACSELFASALARHGFTREEVVVRPRRATPEALAALPPFGVWWLEGTSAKTDAQCIAEGVRQMLADAAKTPVVDRATGEVRAVRPGHIAVLVATNAMAEDVAKALHARGLRAALARPGLLATPEGVLTDAALRWLSDPGDQLAAAKIDALLGYESTGGSADAWLEAVVRQGEEARKRRREAREGGGAEAGAVTPDADAPRVVDAPTGWRAALGPVAARLAVLSPSEALDEALAALDAVHVCARWPDPAQRVANLDALRALASTYEARCGQEREAATVAGLLRTFDEIQQPSLQKDEMIASDEQHVPEDDGAVTVCTYHRSKGLEWPVVVLGQLDRGERRDAFEVCPETEGEGFDPEAPLAGRWIRYWPWAFGGLGKVKLAEDAAASAEGQRVAAREQKERARLLYVGFTRARDHLVLAVRLKTSKAGGAKPAAGWLEVLAGEDGEGGIGLPVEAAHGAEGVVTIAAREPVSVAARVWRLQAKVPEVERAATVHRWFARPEGGGVAAALPRYRIRPSNAREDWPDLAVPAVAGIEALGGAMALDGKVAESSDFGDAVHAFFAADVPGLTDDERLGRARRLLVAHGVVGVVSPESLVAASDRLRAFIDARWPGATVSAELPVDAVVLPSGAQRRLAGIIDLHVRGAAESVIIDHKTFPGVTDASLLHKTESFLAQLAAYTSVHGDATPSAVHFPFAGRLVHVRSSERSRTTSLE